MNPTWGFLRLQCPGPGNDSLREGLARMVSTAWDEAGVRLWGVFEGLFGIASNELLVVAVTETDPTLESVLAPLRGGQPPIWIREATPFEATVRPTGTERLTRPGLYVLRFFEVRSANVDEIVRLSQSAWESFEHAGTYKAEPLGLFREAAAGDQGRMLLVTWYDGLASWQTSRQPAPEASANFQRRRALTLGSVAYATRLAALPEVTTSPEGS